MVGTPSTVAGQPGAWFCGEGAVTGVGSLPFVDPGRAIDFVARVAPELPFWPQLRRVSPREAMIPQLLGPAFKHLVAVRDEYMFRIPSDRVDRFISTLGRDDARIEPANAAGLYAFVDAFERGAFPSARAAKGQLMGPVTTACSLDVDGAAALEHAQVRDAVANHVVRVASAQAEMLLRVAPSVVLVLDEAYLGVALRTRPEQRGIMVELLRSAVLRIRRPGVLVGMHCCDRIPLAVANDIAVDVLSFDAHHGADLFAVDVEARRFLADGGQVAWGWVPTRDDVSGVDPVAVAHRWWDVAQRLCDPDAGVDLARIQCRSMVTASCGLAGSSEATCERSFAIAHEISKRFRERVEVACR